MNARRLLTALFIAALASSALAATRTIRIFEKRQIVIALPEGWKFNLTKDNQTGVQTKHLEDRGGEVKLEASFLPDSENDLATREALEGRLRATSEPMLQAAVEQEMKVTTTKTSDGLITYSTFTDRRFAEGDVPRDERRYATEGIRSWPGVSLHFTILTNELTSDEYRAALEILTQGLREVAK